MTVRPILAAATCAAAVLTFAAVPAQAATNPLQITRVYVNSPGADLPTTNTKLNGEYVTIKNTARTSKTLTGYTLRDESHHVYTFTSFTLKAGTSVKVHTGKGTNTATNRYMGRGYYIWNNSGGDSATLKTSGGTKVDSCAWGTVASYTDC